MPDRRGHRAGVRHPHRQQAHFRHPHGPGGRAPRETADYVPFAAAMDEAAKAVRRQLHRRLFRPGAEGHDRRATRSSSPPSPRRWPTPSWCVPRVNVGSTKAGINMDAVAPDGPDHQGRRPSAPPTEAASAAPSWWCSATRWRTTPSWPAPSTAWARRSCVINVGVSGPGVVHHALQAVKGQPFDVVAETIKKTAFRITRMGQLVAQEASPPAGRALRHRGPVPGPHPGRRGLAWPASWRRWAWRSAAPTAPPPPWPCSTTR